ncbi:hypothetical protein J0664_18845 [Rhizobium leguminosarum]|nr:hypothetical protein J0664_18845 [Rhizobium leguminosarum]
MALISIESREIDVENENPVEHIDKAGEISRAAAKEGDGVVVIGDHGFDFVDIPNVMLVHPSDSVGQALMGKPIQRFTSLGIADIRQFPVTVDDVITAPLQLFRHRGFAGAGNAFDQIVLDAHFRSR